MNYQGYTFFIDDTLSEVEVFPAISTLTFVYEPDREFGFFRLVIQEEMPFTDADYTFVKALDDAGCASYDFIVKLYGTEVYRGVLKTQANTNVNLRDCVISARIEPQDAYTCLTEGWETEFNIFNGTNKETAISALGTTSEIECEEYGDDVLELLALGAPDSCLTAPTGAWALLQWVIEEDNLIPPPNNIKSTATWIREEFTTACSGGSPVEPPGGGWLLVADNCGTTSDADWARQPALVLDFFENNGTRYEERYVLASVDADDYPNGIPLAEILEVFHPCGSDIVSDFFSINPDATYPANDAYTAAIANLANVLVFQKSDVRLPNATAPASVGRMNYRALLRWLKFQFNVEPRFVAGDFRIEHVSYWAAGPGIDMSVPPYSNLVGVALSYSYDNENLARIERWSFMEAVSTAFAGRPVEYADCVPDGTESERPYNLDRVNNDIAYISANPDLASDDGFSFVATALIGGVYYIITEFSLDSFTMALNGHMAIANLLYNYQRWDRLLPTGTMNASVETFESSLPRRLQPDFTVILSRATFHTGFDPDEYVITELGNGEVQRASFDGFSCSLTLSLKYQ